MPKLILVGEEFEVDEDGFLQEPDRWNDNIAKALAKAAEGIEELTEEHWKAINYIRQYYLQYGQAPMVRKLCKDTGLNLKQIYNLFPSGPARGVCKIAGLPKPAGCV